MFQFCKWNKFEARDFSTETKRGNKNVLAVKVTHDFAPEIRDANKKKAQICVEKSKWLDDINTFLFFSDYYQKFQFQWRTTLREIWNDLGPVSSKRFSFFFFLKLTFFRKHLPFERKIIFCCRRFRHALVIRYKMRSNFARSVFSLKS